MPTPIRTTQKPVADGYRCNVEGCEKERGWDGDYCVPHHDEVMAARFILQKMKDGDLLQRTTEGWELENERGSVPVKAGILYRAGYVELVSTFNGVEMYARTFKGKEASR